MREPRDCHFCNFACCDNQTSNVDCYCEDNAYFDHHVTDSKEAKTCNMFEYCGSFPKW